jgi:hypothetical protein
MAALEDEVVEVCAKHQRDHWKEAGYRAAVRVRTEFFIKFGDVESLRSESATQHYLFNRATSDHRPNIPRIPRVMHCFERNHVMYMVTEFITLMPTPPDFISHTRAALTWLASVPAPPGLVLGPVGGGLIRHHFFKDHEAPLIFSSVQALERYIERVRLGFFHSLVFTVCSKIFCARRAPRISPRPGRRYFL